MKISPEELEHILKDISAQQLLIFQRMQEARDKIQEHTDNFLELQQQFMDKAELAFIISGELTRRKEESNLKVVWRSKN